jgi:putative transposase
VTDSSDVKLDDDETVEVVLPPLADPAADARQDLAARLVEDAQATGVSLVGPGGLLAELTKQVLELGLEVEMSGHLGYANTRSTVATAGTRAMAPARRRC